MEGLLGREHTGAAIVEGGELQGILIGLGTRVDEKQLIILVTRHLAQGEGKFLLQGVLHRVAVETQACNLRGNGLDIMGMCMTYADDGMTAIEVEIFCSLFVPYVASLATVYGNVEKGIYVK